MAKYTCACGAKYKFPDSSYGKKARCGKCGAIFTLPEDPDSVALAPEAPFIDETVRAVATQGVLFIPPSAPGFAASGTLGHAVTSAVETPTRPFVSDVLWTFLFPTTPGNFVTFLMLWLMLIFAKFLGSGFFPGLFQILAWGMFLAVVGCYYTYLFAVLAAGAGGDEELPRFDPPNSWLLEGIQAIVKWIGSWVVVFLPAAAYRLWYWSVQPVPGTTAAGPGVMQPQIMPVQDWPGWMTDLFAAANGLPGIMSLPPDGLDPFKVLVALGLFLWPIVALCVVLGGFSTLYRLDLMLVTIWRSFGPYLVTVALIWAAFFVEDTLSSLTIGAAVGAGGATFGASLRGAICILGLRVYFDIVLMRLIGLYYHHFKKTFLWNWG